MTRYLIQNGKLEYQLQETKKNTHDRIFLEISSSALLQLTAAAHWQERQTAAADCCRSRSGATSDVDIVSVCALPCTWQAGATRARTGRL